MGYSWTDFLHRYKKYSLQFYTILMGHADDLQAVSVDEALIDVTSSVRRIEAYVSQSDTGHGRENVDPAKDFADAIRSQVRKATNCEGMKLFPLIVILLMLYCCNL